MKKDTVGGMFVKQSKGLFPTFENNGTFLEIIQYSRFDRMKKIKSYFWKQKHILEGKNMRRK